MRSLSRVLLGIGLVLAGARPVEAQGDADVFPPTVPVRTAAEALQFLLDMNIKPGGPLRDDGALIAGVLAGQSLTFPVGSSAGAFTTRELTAFGPEPVEVSATGSFGPLFAERGRTGGRGNFSLSLGFQHVVWGSLAGEGLQDFDLSSRRVYRNDEPTGREGTVDEFGVDIDYRTDVALLTATYGVTDYLDVGLATPFISNRVAGTKRLLRARPQEGPEVVYVQAVSGESSGLGDLVVRAKMNVFPAPFQTRKGRAYGEPLGGSQFAVALDWRLPTGRTADLYLDCPAPPCPGGRTQAVPELGLGVQAVKLSGFWSAEGRRLSPHVNVSHLWVPPYKCARDECLGAIFDLDEVNGTQDTKDQGRSNEWTVVAGADYQLVPYRVTIGMDVVGRQLVRAGQFGVGDSRVVFRPSGAAETSVVTEVESRHGNVNSAMGVAGLKARVASRWVVGTHVMFPIAGRGLQPKIGWVASVERAIGR
jgi:hypothetical protein